MLRDCKAVICFGSRVEVEVEGEDGFEDDDDGGEVGDGVGGRGREGDGVVMVGKRMKMKRVKRSGGVMVA